MIHSTVHVELHLVWSITKYYFSSLCLTEINLWFGWNVYKEALFKLRFELLFVEIKTKRYVLSVYFSTFSSLRLSVCWTILLTSLQNIMVMIDNVHNFSILCDTGRKVMYQSPFFIFGGGFIHLCKPKVLKFNAFLTLGRYLLSWNPFWGRQEDF